MTVKEQVKQLWKLCFNDSDAFIDLYFRMRYSDRINSYTEQDGKVVAAFQRVPYWMKLFNRVLPVAYISGACTHPDYRKRGIMRNLLADAHRLMFSEGVMASILIPANKGLETYYNRSGYVSRLQREVLLLTLDNLQLVNVASGLVFRDVSLSDDLPEEVFPFFSRELDACSAVVLHTSEDFKVILADLQLAGGQLWTVYNGESLVGLALCLKERDRLCVKEILCADGETKAALLLFLLHQYEVEQIECVRCATHTVHPFGMIRIVHAEAFLRCYAQYHPEKAFCIKLTDDEISSNCGYYTVSDGVCRRGYRFGQLYRPCSVGELADWLLAGDEPYMNLMLD